MNDFRHIIVTNVIYFKVVLSIEKLQQIRLNQLLLELQYVALLDFREFWLGVSGIKDLGEYEA